MAGVQILRRCYQLLRSVYGRARTRAPVWDARGVYTRCNRFLDSSFVFPEREIVACQIWRVAAARQAEPTFAKGKKGVWMGKLSGGRAGRGYRYRACPRGKADGNILQARCRTKGARNAFASTSAVVVPVNHLHFLNLFGERP